MIRAITVYCSSTANLAESYVTAASELGQAIAQNKWELVYGGNDCGLMKSVADGARSAGGRVIGITPQLFIDKGLGDNNCHDLVVTENMRDRKAVLEARGDAFVALPGGIGTLDEFFDVITHKQLAYHNKPVVLLNIKKYFDPLVTLLERGIDERFIRPAAREYFHLADTVPGAMDYLRSFAD